jgi:hypothetical protein
MAFGRSQVSHLLATPAGARSASRDADGGCEGYNVSNMRIIQGVWPLCNRSEQRHVGNQTLRRAFEFANLALFLPSDGHRKL